MWSVVLSNSLVNEYLDFRFNKQFNRDKVGKLLKYILSFPLKSSHPLMQDPSFAADSCHRSAYRNFKQ